MVISKKNCLNRVHHRDTFSVSSDNNKWKYTRIDIPWYHAISSKYTFICWEINGSITVMCNYLWLMKIIFNVTSSTSFNFQNVYSDEFPKFKSSTLEEIFWRRTCQGGYHAISSKYTFICWEINGSITVMCNYLWLMKIIFNVTSSTSFNFQNVYSDEFPKFKSGTLEEIFWRRTCQGGKWEVKTSTHIIC